MADRRRHVSVGTTAGTVAAGDHTHDNVQSTTSEPPRPKIGDLWMNPATGQLMEWDGSEWVVTTTLTREMVSGGVKTSGFTAEKNTYYELNYSASLGTVPITLPTAPEEGTQVGFTRLDSNQFTTNPQLTCGGSDHISGRFGSGTTWSVTMTGAFITFRYVSTTATWLASGNGFAALDGSFGLQSSATFSPSIVVRDSNGNSEVNNPTSAKHAANQNYVTIIGRAITPSAYGMATAASGTTNATAITDALDDAQAAGVGIVLPAGTFNCDAISYHVPSSGATDAGNNGEQPIRIDGAKGRAATVLQFSATSGYALDFGGTATDGTLKGIPVGSRISNLEIVGPGSSSNTLTALRLAAFDHFDLEDVVIRDVGQDGVFLDRQDYTVGVLDDRGNFPALTRVKIRNVGRDGILAGGTFETDHLVTDRCEVTAAGRYGANIWAQGWHDRLSLFQGWGCVNVRSDNSSFGSLGIVLEGTRMEQGSTDSCLRVGLCQDIVTIGCNIIARSVDAGHWAVILGGNSGENITQATFINNVYNSDGSGLGCFRVSPSGGASVVGFLLGPTPSASFVTQISNPNNQLMGLYTGGAWDQTVGWSAPMRATSITNNRTAGFFRRGETQPRVEIFGADGWIKFGPGSSTVGDTSVRRNSAGVVQISDGSTTPTATVGCLMTGQGATASRPSASTVGQGAQWFDQTLHKPIWSDGTNWRDASGTVV